VTTQQMNETNPYNAIQDILHMLADGHEPMPQMCAVITLYWRQEAAFNCSSAMCQHPYGHLLSYAVNSSKVGRDRLW